MNVEGFFEKQDLITSAKKDFERISQVLEQEEGKKQIVGDKAYLINLALLLYLNASSTLKDIETLI